MRAMGSFVRSFIRSFVRLTFSVTNRSTTKLFDHVDKGPTLCVLPPLVHFAERDLPLNQTEQRVILPHTHIRPGVEPLPPLPHDNIARNTPLPAEQLDPEKLGIRILVILRRSSLFLRRTPELLMTRSMEQRVRVRAGSRRGRTGHARRRFR